MVNYESFKYCGHLIKGKKCGATANNVCTAGCYHPDQNYSGMAIPPKKSQYVKHPKFLCDEHIELYED